MTWVKRVEAVLDMLKGSSIEEIELTEGDFEMILRRNTGNVSGDRVPLQYQAPAPSLPPPPRVELVEQRTTTIKAPMTGVYYAAPSPNAGPFVKVGDNIVAGQTIALIEAMKVFNEVQADSAGKVVAIQAQDGEVVKKDQPMFQLAPSS